MSLDNRLYHNIAGHTTGTTTDIFVGTYVLAGGDFITLSKNSNTVTINAQSQSIQTQNLVSIQGSTGAISLANSNNITFGFNASTITASASFPAQSIESNTLGVSNVGNTSGTSGVISGGQVQLILAGGNNVTLSQSINGSSATITISAFNQSVQTQNLVDVTLAGNTSGTLALASSGTLTLAGGNNITLSQVGNAVTISAFSQSVQTQNLIDATLAGNTSGTLALVSSGTLTLAGGNNVTLSQVGNAVTISAFTQSVESQSAGVSNLGNTAGTSGIASGGQVRLLLAGGNNVTLSQSINGASATITVSAFNQTVESQSIGMSNVGNTSGTTGMASGGQVQFVLAGGNNITISQSVNGASATATISAFNQTVQTQNLIDATLAGNTSGTLALVSSGTLTLAGGNNVTLSQVGNAVTISAFNQTVESQSAGISNLGNTSGTSGIASGGQVRLLLAGGNNVTLSQSVNGASATVTISAFNQTVESQSAGISNLGNTSGTSGIASGGQVQFLLAGGNNVTLSQSVNGASATVTISAFNQSVESQSAGISNLGNTSGTSGIASGGQIRLLLAGGNNVTLSQSVNGASATVTVSAFNQTAESNTAGISNLGNTSGTSGVISGNQIQLLLAGGNNITLSQSINGSTATVTISAFTQTVQTQNFCANNFSGGNSVGNTFLATSGTVAMYGGNNITLSLDSVNQKVTVSAFNQTVESQSFGMSNLGNTAGTTGIASGGQVQFVLVGSNNVTLSQSINGASGTISFSVNSGVNSAGTQTIGMSNLGNSSGTTGTVTGSAVQYLFAGGNNITLSQSLNGISGTLTISGPNIASGSFGVSNLGNTLGTSGIASGSSPLLLIVGTKNLSISQSVNGASATLTLVPEQITQRIWPDIFNAYTGSTLYSGSTNSGAGASTSQSSTSYSLYAFPAYIGARLEASAINMGQSFQTAAGTGSMTFGASLGLYTITAGTLSLVTSFQRAFVLSQNSTSAITITYWFGTTSTTQSSGFNGNSTALIQGLKHVFFLSDSNNYVTIAPGQYYFVVGHDYRTSNANINGGLSLMHISEANSSALAFGGLTSRTNPWLPGMFAFSTSTSSVSNVSTYFPLPTSIDTAAVSTATHPDNLRHMFVEFRG